MSSAIRDRCKRLVLSDHLLQEVMSRLNADIDKGLHKDTHATATVKCFPTFIQDLPQGTETGKFLALDLGGTNFRVLMIYAGEKFRMEHKTYPISPEIMTGPGEQLFDYIAESLENFVREQKAENEHLPLGFTFSFPVDMMSLTKGESNRGAGWSMLQANGTVWDIIYKHKTISGISNVLLCSSSTTISKCKCKCKVLYGSPPCSLPLTRCPGALDQRFQMRGCGRS